jgi:hypothetical protein
MNGFSKAAANKKLRKKLSTSAAYNPITDETIPG